MIFSPPDKPDTAAVAKPDAGKTKPAASKDGTADKAGKPKAKDVSENTSTGSKKIGRD